VCCPANAACIAKKEVQQPEIPNHERELMRTLPLSLPCGSTLLPAFLLMHPPLRRGTRIEKLEI